MQVNFGILRFSAIFMAYPLRWENTLTVSHQPFPSSLKLVRPCFPGPGLNLTPPNRCTHNSIRSEAWCNKPTQLVYRRDLLLGCNRYNHAVFLRTQRQQTCWRGQLFLVFVPGFQYSGCSKQSPWINLETSHVVSPSDHFYSVSFRPQT